MRGREEMKIYSGRCCTISEGMDERLGLRQKVKIHEGIEMQKKAKQQQTLRSLLGCLCIYLSLTNVEDTG